MVRRTQSPSGGPCAAVGVSPAPDRLGVAFDFLSGALGLGRSRDGIRRTGDLRGTGGHGLRLGVGVLPRVGTGRVHAVGPPLVQVAEEDDVVAEARQAVHPRHVDEERRHVVHERVERLVDERAPGKVVHGLQLVVDVNLGRHHDEAEGVDGPRSDRYDVGVPRLVLLVEERVDGVAQHTGQHDHAHVLYGHLVVLLGVGLDLDADGLGDLPGRGDQADGNLKEDEPGDVLAVENVERDDDVAREVDQHREGGETLHGVGLVPELNVVLEGEEREDAVQQDEGAREDEHVDVGGHEGALEHLKLLSGLLAQNAAGLAVHLELRGHQVVGRAAGGEVDLELQRGAVHLGADALVVLLQDPELRQVHEGVIDALGLVDLVRVKVHVLGVLHVRSRVVDQVYVEPGDPVLAHLLLGPLLRLGSGRPDETDLLAVLHPAHRGQGDGLDDDVALEALFEGRLVEGHGAGGVGLVRDHEHNGIELVVVVVEEAGVGGDGGSGDVESAVEAVRVSTVLRGEDKLSTVSQKLQAHACHTSRFNVRRGRWQTDRTGSPTHSVLELVRFLTDNHAAAKQLDEHAPWQLEQGGTYYVADANATMMAFHVGKNFDPAKGGVVIAVGHTDSPALKLEYKCEATAHAFNQVVPLTYTSGLWHTWMDRDLGLAGRVIVRNEGVLEERLLRIQKPLIVTPNLSIHFQNAAEREVLKLNREKHLRGIISTEAVHKLSGEIANPLLAYIAKDLGVKVEDIVDMDLCLMDSANSALSGLYEEFLSSGRLDNLATSFAAVGGFLDFVNGTEVRDSEYISCIIFYNYEEMGSLMASGAHSQITFEWLDKMFAALGSSFVATKGRALILNMDMSHAVHPNYPERHPDTHQPRFHGGLIMKRNVNGRYATDLRGSAIVTETARARGVPVQDFRVPNDSPCGSTVGPFLSSRLCVPVVDVGIAQLAMHSIREVCSAVDIWHLKEVVNSFLRPRGRSRSEVDQSSQLGLRLPFGGLQLEDGGDRLVVAGEHEVVAGVAGAAQARLGGRRRGAAEEDAIAPGGGALDVVVVRALLELVGGVERDGRLLQAAHVRLDVPHLGEELVVLQQLLRLAVVNVLENLSRAVVVVVALNLEVEVAGEDQQVLREELLERLPAEDVLHDALELLGAHARGQLAGVEVHVDEGEAVTSHGEPHADGALVADVAAEAGLDGARLEVAHGVAKALADEDGHVEPDHGAGLEVDEAEAAVLVGLAERAEDLAVEEHLLVLLGLAAQDVHDGELDELLEEEDKDLRALLHAARDPVADVVAAGERGAVHVPGPAPDDDVAGELPRLVGEGVVAGAGDHGLGVVEERAVGVAALADVLRVDGGGAGVDPADVVAVRAPHLAELARRAAEVVLAVLVVLQHVGHAVGVEHAGQPDPRDHELHGVGAVEAVEAVDAEYAALGAGDVALLEPRAHRGVHGRGQHVAVEVAHAVERAQQLQVHEVQQLGDHGAPLDLLVVVVLDQPQGQVAEGVHEVLQRLGEEALAGLAVEEREHADLGARAVEARQVVVVEEEGALALVDGPGEVGLREDVALAPEDGHGAAGLHEALPGAAVDADAHLALDEVAHVALAVDAARVQAGPRAVDGAAADEKQLNALAVPVLLRVAHVALHQRRQPVRGDVVGEAAAPVERGVGHLEEGPGVRRAARGGEAPRAQRHQVLLPLPLERVREVRGAAEVVPGREEVV
ncbi:aspartyl aminopeptidase [Babesia caballi]|uniref:aspartyl aminopeptidase n=1 Tax=Babesia caballi TaxID=5871 RepID=A0AAV4LSE9_BABCB|nr:aspartyl aminopeptidase [Babesia caballi]